MIKRGIYMLLKGDLLKIMLLAATLLMAGCSDHGALPTTQNRIASGYASKGIIKNGTVSAYKIDGAGNKILPLLAQTTTDDTGLYKMSIGAYYGPISIEVSGNYKDEATGQTATISAAAPLKAATMPPNDATAITVNVTALTQIAFEQTINQVKSKSIDFTASINATNILVSNSFQVPDILTTKPLDSSTTLSAAATAGEKQYTLVLAAVSQIAANNLPAATVTATSQQLATALAEAVTTLALQLPTGGAVATSLQITVATAATEFINNPTVNTTGITVTDPAVQPILAANARKNVTITIAIAHPAAPVPLFGAVHGGLTVPVGMSCQADGLLGELQSLMVNTLQSGAYANANFNPVSRQLTVQSIGAAGLSLGDLLAVTCNVPSTMTPLAGDFTVSTALDVNNGGLSFSGFSLVVSSVK